MKSSKVNFISIMDTSIKALLRNYQHMKQVKSCRNIHYQHFQTYGFLNINQSNMKYMTRHLRVPMGIIYDEKFESTHGYNI